MTVKGIETVFLETHNWGKTARFLQGLGFEVEFETGHNSGQFRMPEGPTVFVAEIAPTQPPGLKLVVGVPDTTHRPTADVDIVTDFEPTHYGTQEMTVRDPDGREWALQAPGV
ncbi:VOC family protein [Nocardia sp. NBC_00511]|uniref:VOC family protein n=1 Tax=Nocardia sp. NBC_00511 TaxID=2903591 RepID=UPI0030E1BA4B